MKFIVAKFVKMEQLTENILFAGRYRLLEVKGRGSFGEVWRAMDEKLQSEVAIKVYIALDPKGLEEFVSEYKVANTLSHPNLLHADYFDVWNNRPFIVMPYCPDSSGSLIGRMNEETAWRFLRDVSGGLAYLHGKGIIHRDIKPDNILRDKEGRFLISDFGISTKMRSTLRRNSTRLMDEKNDLAGTVGYMAPELFSSKPAAVNATDIWALGASLCELLTGEMPFMGQGGVMLLHGAEIPQIGSEYSMDLQEVVSACLSKEVQDRPTAEQLYEFVEAKLNGVETIPFRVQGKTDSSTMAIPKPSASMPKVKEEKEKGESATRNTKYSAKEPIHGWLLFFLILMGLGAASSLVRVLIHTSVGGNPIFYADLSRAVLAILFVSYMIYAFIQRKPNAVFLSKAYVIFLAGFSLVVGVLESTYVGETNALLLAILSIINAIIWFLFLCFSEQVNERIPKSKRKAGRVSWISLMVLVLIPILVRFIEAKIFIDNQNRRPEMIDLSSLDADERTDGRIVFRIPEGYAAEKVIEEGNNTYYDLSCDFDGLFSHGMRIQSFDGPIEPSEELFETFSKGIEPIDIESLSPIDGGLEKYRLDGNPCFIRTIKLNYMEGLSWTVAMLFHERTGRMCAISAYVWGNAKNPTYDVVRSVRFE